MAELGRITPVKAYQTTDGKKFVGDNAKEEAYAHQRMLNLEKETEKVEPKKTSTLSKLLKKKGKKKR